MSLRDHLVEHRIAGDVATPRQSNLTALHRLAEGQERAWFGIEPDRAYGFDEVFEVMVKRCGIDPDAGRTEGADTIDPDLTLDALDATGERLAKAARDRERVFFATGHPAGVLAIHLPVAQALRDAGCEVLTPGAGTWHEYAGKRRQIRYVAGVACVSDRGELNHTHSAVPMRALLDGGLRPDLVMADHGWAGAAAQAGIDVVCFADCNDPALFVGAEEGKVGVVVPLDDNVLPHLYAPLTDRLLASVEG